jgi:hypothetical protein
VLAGSGNRATPEASGWVPITISLVNAMVYCGLCRPTDLNPYSPRSEIQAPLVYPPKTLLTCDGCRKGDHRSAGAFPLVDANR